MLERPDKLRDIEVSLENLTIAFTHPSYKTVDPLSEDFQRLELIGDAVLDLLVIERLIEQLESDEGVLSTIRSRIVNNANLAQVGTSRINISPYLRVAPAYNIQERDLAAVIEAIFGACYTDSGLKECRKLFQQLLGTQLELAILNEKHSSGKTSYLHDDSPKTKSVINIMLEYFQKMHLELPVQKTQNIGGTDHEPIFKTGYTAIINGQRVIGSGKGKNKKIATEKAAIDLCKKLKIDLFQR